jgi:hypothetical protein
VNIWSHVQMSNYRIKYGIITNNLKCQFRRHRCDRLVETIKMNILLDYFGAWVEKILNTKEWDPHEVAHRKWTHTHRAPAGSTQACAQHLHRQAWRRIHTPPPQHAACSGLVGPSHHRGQARCAGNGRLGHGSLRDGLP